MKRTYMLALGIAIPLVAAGCGGGGGGLFSLFGSDGTSDILDSFGSGSDSGSGTTTVASSGGSGPSGSSSTIVNPEPASVGLFATGLAGLALARRRKKTRK